MFVNTQKIKKTNEFIEDLKKIFNEKKYVFVNATEKYRGRFGDTCAIIVHNVSVEQRIEFMKKVKTFLEEYANKNIDQELPLVIPDEGFDLKIF